MQKPSEDLKTESEKLFARYLRSRRIVRFQYHPEFLKSRKHPDFLVHFAGQEVICEVAEFNGSDPERSAREQRITGGCIAPPHLRVQKKIAEEWKQLRDFSDYCCCFVLYDPGRGIPVLERDFIFEAMLGSQKIFIPSDRHHGGRAEETFRAFSEEGGEMRWESGEAHKSNVSAIVVLEEYPVGERLFSATSAKADMNLRGVDRYVKRWEEMKRARGTQRDVSRTELRVVVYRNPYSATRLPQRLFCGPYDEHYGFRCGTVARIFVGREIRELEAKGGRPRSPLAEIMKRSEKCKARGRRLGRVAHPSAARVSPRVDF